MRWGRAAGRAGAPVRVGTPVDDADRQLLAAVLEELRGLRAGPARAPVAVTVLALYQLYEAARSHEPAWRLIKCLLRPFVERLGTMAAADVTPVVWYTHRAERAKTPTRLGRPPCAATRNGELLEARAMLRWAVSGRLIASNPLDDAKPEPAVSQRETWLTVEQFERLVATVPVALRLPYQRALLLVYLFAAVGSGVRISEALLLRRDQIADDGSITLVAKRTKSKRTRTVTLTSRALAAIADVPPLLGSPYVFANADTGEPFGDDALRRWFRDVAIAAGLDASVAEGDLRLLPHDMRHTFASQADERGARLRDIQHTLGHASSSTTERYCHQDRARRARSVAALMDTPAASQRAR